MLARVIMQFSDNLEGLREFVNDVSPFLHDRAFQRVRDNPYEILLLIHFLREMCAFDLKPLPPNIKEAEWNEIIENLKDNITIDVCKDENRNVHATMNIRADLGEKFIETVGRYLSDIHSTKLLYKNSLIALVSAAEWFIAQLFRRTECKGCLTLSRSVVTQGLSAVTPALDSRNTFSLDALLYGSSTGIPVLLLKQEHSPWDGPPAP